MNALEMMKTYSLDKLCDAPEDKDLRRYVLN